MVPRTQLDIHTVVGDDPRVLALMAEVQQEYVDRYGHPDETPMDAAEFAAPHGMFLLALLAGDPVACGGWRGREGPAPLSPGDVEVKRMYVVPRARRLGLARQILAELERTAFAAGRRRVVLETGTKQPEALTLYRAQGYQEIAKFGPYRDDPHSVCFGKHLTVD